MNMPIYVIKQGDCLSSVAKQRGFAWKKLWNLPENAELRSQRRDPNILYPGDELFIPELQGRQVDSATDKNHHFQVVDSPAKLKLKLLLNMKERSRIPFTFSCAGTTQKGSTGAHGGMEVNIPADATSATLELQPPDGTSESYSLKLGNLDPIDEVSGVKGRLWNLGFYAGPIDKTESAEYSAGLTFFQKAAGLHNSPGKADPQTKKDLQKAYGS
jgi:hypothetical protein